MKQIQWETVVQQPGNIARKADFVWVTKRPVFYLSRATFFFLSKKSGEPKTATHWHHQGWAFLKVWSKSNEKRLSSRLYKLPMTPRYTTFHLCLLHNFLNIHVFLVLKACLPNHFKWGRWCTKRFLDHYWRSTARPPIKKSHHFWDVVHKPDFGGHCVRSVQKHMGVLNITF